MLMTHFLVQSKSRTWHTCFQCHYSRHDEGICDGVASGEKYAAPFCRRKKGFNIVDVGNYAAQLAWWFSFFRPGRFLIISHAELQHVEGRLEVWHTWSNHTTTTVVRGRSVYTPDTCIYQALLWHAELPCCNKR